MITYNYLVLVYIILDFEKKKERKKKVVNSSALEWTWVLLERACDFSRPSFSIELSFHFKSKSFLPPRLVSCLIRP